MQQCERTSLFLPFGVALPGRSSTPCKGGTACVLQCLCMWSVCYAQVHFSWLSRWAENRTTVKTVVNAWATKATFSVSK